MSGFEKQETAVRVREAIRRVAERRIQIASPGVRIGRVMTVDMPKLQATVWFPGDATPVSVSMFSNIIPGANQSQNSSGDSTSTSGYGSMVACEPFRGTLYITQVLTGGQFSYNHKALNLTVVSSAPITDPGDSDYGHETESILNVSISEELDPGEAAVFGPFIIQSDAGFGGFNNSWFEINTSDARGSRSYKFNLASYADFLDKAPGSGGEYDRWLRVNPEQEIITDYLDDPYDFHFDVVAMQTQHGIDDSGFQYNEIWFRFVSDNATLVSAAMDVSIRSGLLHRTGRVNGNRSLVSYVDSAPVLIKGYLGFHNSNFTMFDLDDLSWRDRFDRTLSGTWGGYSDSPDVYTTAGGGTPNYGVDGANGTITPTATATVYRTFSNRTKTDFDYYARFNVSQLATGSFYEILFPVRQTATNNYYAFVFLVNTTNSIDIKVLKQIAGVDTVISTVAAAGTLAANTSWMMRGQLRGNEFRMKIWLASATEPVAWTLGPVTDSAITGAGSMGCLVRRNTGNTSNSLVVRFEELNCYTNPTLRPNPNDGRWSTGPYRNSLLRIGELLQRTWLCDGLFTWDGTNIKWTGKIWFTGIGSHSRGLIDGITSVSCPTATYSIPVMGGTSGNTLVTMNSSGIPLAAGQSLWCGIPPGVKALDLLHHLFIVDSPRGGRPVSVPEWAVLIAQRQPASAAAGAVPIRLGNGNWLDAVPHNVLRGETGEQLVTFASNTFNTTNVTFGRVFPTKPSVHTNINTSAGGQAQWQSRAINVSTTGFTIFVFTAGAASAWTNVPVLWSAVTSS